MKDNVTSSSSRTLCNYSYDQFRPFERETNTSLTIGSNIMFKMLYEISAILIVVLLGYHVHRIRSKPGLRHIPGPFIASFTNFWKISAVFHGDMPRRNIEVHRKYGPVVRIGPKHVSFKTLAALRTIYNSRQQFSKVMLVHMSQID